MIRRICISLVWVFITLFYRHRVYGKKNIPKQGGIIAPNHCSFLDPPIVGVSCPDVIHFLARDSLFEAPFFGWLIKKLNTHPIRKGQGNLNTFKKATELIQSGKKVVIFPEGLRSLDGTLQPGQLGVGMLVFRTGCLVIPVYIHGTFEAWNSQRKFPRLSGKTACVFGKPLDFSKMIEEGEKKEIQTEITNQIMAKIGELKAWYLGGAKGNPP